MTTKNNLITGILIGIVLIITPIILISTSTVSSNEEQNNYKFYINQQESEYYTWREGGYLLNLKDGNLWHVVENQKKLVNKVDAFRRETN